MRLSTILLLLTVSTTSIRGSLRLVQDLHVGAARSVTLVGVPKANEIASQAEHFLGSSGVTLGRLIVYESEHAAKLAIRETYLQCAVEGVSSFLSANDLYPEPMHCPVVWEVVKIGPNMLQRWVDRSCRTRRALLRGNSDPLFLSLEDALYEILHVSIQVDHPSTLAGDGRFPSIGIYVRTTSNLSTSEDAVKRILSDIKDRSGARQVGIRVRNDALFAHHCAFPVLYLFDDSPPIIAAPGDPRLRGAELDCSSVHSSSDARCFYFPAKTTP
jgi:hypothetical protein